MAGTPRTARKIVLFNHKGGVGKTTLTVNLAYALVEAGKRVLLVDTDPQCSLSSFFLEEKYLDKLLDDSESENGNTIWSALRPVSEGTGSLAQLEPIVFRDYDKLFLAAGDIRLSEFESTLSECWNQCLNRNKRGYNCTTALSRLVDRLVATTRADFVFFDAGPNIGPLNRVVLLDSTHFVVPAACDLFSARALKTLGYAISDWITTWQRISEMAPDSTPLLIGAPSLLGFIPQQFRIYGGRMAEAPLAVLSTLETRIRDFVWKPLELARGNQATDPPRNLKLGEVKNWGVLVTKSQAQGCPIWSIDGGNVYAKDEAREVFRNIARRVIAETA